MCKHKQPFLAGRDNIQLPIARQVRQPKVNSHARIPAPRFAIVHHMPIQPPRFFAFAGLGLLFSLTTNPYDLVKAMQKNAKLPRKFAYGMLCAINLMPYIKSEYNNAKLAFQVRGVRVSAFSIKPVFSMLVNCFRWSEVMSIAMFSKGFHEER